MTEGAATVVAGAAITVVVTGTGAELDKTGAAAANELLIGGAATAGGDVTLEDAGTAAKDDATKVVVGVTVIAGFSEVVTTPAAEGAAIVVMGVTVTTGLTELLMTPATDGAATVVVGVIEMIGLTELLTTPPVGVGNTVEVGVIVTTGARELLAMPPTDGAATVEVGVMVTTGLINEMLDTEGLSVGDELRALEAPAKVEVVATTEATGAIADPMSVATAEDECEMSGVVTNGVALAEFDTIGIGVAGVDTPVERATGGGLRDVTAGDERTVDRPVLDSSAPVLDATLDNPDTIEVTVLSTPLRGCKPADDAARVPPDEAAAAAGDVEDEDARLVELGLVEIEEELANDEEAAETAPADPELVAACPKGDRPPRPADEGIVPTTTVLGKDVELNAIELTLGNIVDSGETDIELSVGIVANARGMELSVGITTAGCVIEPMVESEADDNEIELGLDNVTDASVIELTMDSDADDNEIELRLDSVMLGARPLVSCAEDITGVLVEIGESGI